MAKKGVYEMFLSFVVPVYNAAQYLPECLDWLCRHLHTRWGFSLMWLLQRPVQWKRLLAARAKNA